MNELKQGQEWWHSADSANKVWYKTDAPWKRVEMRVINIFFPKQNATKIFRWNFCTIWHIRLQKLIEIYFTFKPHRWLREDKKWVLYTRYLIAWRYSINIINPRNNIWGKTANGKTLRAFLVFVPTCRKVRLI